MLVLSIVLRVSPGTHAAGLANMPLGLAAEEIVDRQHRVLFPDRTRIDPGGCVRGEAVPWFSGRNQSAASWHFRSVSTIQSVEAVVTTAGDAITVVNQGCEYYSVSLRYDFAENPETPDKRRWWYEKAARALARARELGAAPVFDLELNEQLLLRASEGESVPEEIMDVPVEGDGLDFLQTRLSVTGYGALPQGSGSYVELRLVKGPL